MSGVDQYFSIEIIEIAERLRADGYQIIFESRFSNRSGKIDGAWHLRRMPSADSMRVPQDKDVFESDFRLERNLVDCTASAIALELFLNLVAGRGFMSLPRMSV